jgi:hypothetical protein
MATQEAFTLGVSTTSKNPMMAMANDDKTAMNAHPMVK